MSPGFSSHADGLLIERRDAGQVALSSMCFTPRGVRQLKPDSTVGSLSQSGGEKTGEH